MLVRLYEERNSYWQNEYSSMLGSVMQAREPNRWLETMRRINCKSPVDMPIYQNQFGSRASRKRIYTAKRSDILPRGIGDVYKSYNILLGWHWKARAFITANWFPMVGSRGRGTSVRRNFRPISSLLLFAFDIRTPFFTVFASLRIFLVTSRALQTLLAMLQTSLMDLKP